MDDAFEIHAEGHPDQVVADVSAQVKQAAVGRAGLWPQLVALRDAVCAEVRAHQAEHKAEGVQVSVRATVIRKDGAPEIRVEHRSVERWVLGPSRPDVTHPRSIRTVGVGVPGTFPRFPGDTGEV